MVPCILSTESMVFMAQARHWLAPPGYKCSGVPNACSDASLGIEDVIEHLALIIPAHHWPPHGPLPVQQSQLYYRGLRLVFSILSCLCLVLYIPSACPFMRFASRSASQTLQF